MPAGFSTVEVPGVPPGNDHSHEVGLPVERSVKFTEEDILLRIFVSEASKINGKPLYEQIVLKAKEMGMAGATASRGMLGFGADSHLHSAKILDLSANLPMIIEIADREESINRFLPYLDETVSDGFITMERVKVIKYRHK